MYHKKRLTQKTLRKITKEYLRGGNFKKTFSLELLPDEREILKQQLKVNELSKPIKNIPKLENEIQKKTKKYNKPEKKPENKTIENKNIYLTNQMWSKKPKVNHVAELNIVNKPNNIIKTNKKQKQIDISQVNAVVPAIITGLVIGSALIVFWLMN
jgi:hypothetical protein